MVRGWWRWAASGENIHINRFWRVVGTTFRFAAVSWTGVTCSADGSQLVLVANGGQIYTSSQGSTTAGTAGYLSGARLTTVELEYVGNGVFMPLSHEGTIRAY